MLKFKVFFTNLVFACAVLCIFVTYINYMESSQRIRLFDYDWNASRNLSESRAGGLKVRNKSSDVVILLWNKFFHNYDYMFGTDGRSFVGENKCPVSNCIVTSDRTMYPIARYDAIVFHGTFYNGSDVPSERVPSQYYAFVGLEPPSRFPLLNDFIDFFNWTLTYRFDSDFLWPYFKIKNKRGDVVSPALNPKWESYESSIVIETTVPTLRKKTKTVAWFVSHCTSDNKREQYVRQLQKHIKVDIYGSCGPLACSRKNETKCFELLRDDYHFYLAFENSHCVDYMTEKAYNALMFDTIPVVFGGVNFTKYIPPHSYLDANLLDPQQMANVMKKLIDNPEEYARHFWWKPYYEFHNLGNEFILAAPDVHPFCEMCQALKDTSRPRKIYKNLKKWWHSDPNYSQETPICVRPR